MARYSKGFKISVIKKVLPPSNRSIRKVAKETGISEYSIYIWLKKQKMAKGKWTAF